MEVSTGEKWFIVILLGATALSGCSPTSGGGEESLLQELTLVSEGPVVVQANGADLTTQIDIGESVPLDVVLSPHSVRSQDWNMTVAVEDPSSPGQYLFDPPVTAVPAESTYRGKILGDPNSEVLSTSDGQTLTAMLTLGDGRCFVVTPPEPSAPPSPMPGANLHQVYEMNGPGLLSNPATSGNYAVVELAIDVDTEFYAKRGYSDANTLRFIENAVDSASFIFERHFGIQLKISSLNIWRMEPDPYYSLDTKDLVTGFKNFWNVHRASVPRDIALLISGKEMNRFGASVQPYIGYVCDLFNSYALASAGSSPVGSPQESTDLIKSIAHEIGHVFSAEHCDGQPDCGVMCGCSLQFGSASTLKIFSHLNTLSCLDYVKPNLPGDLPNLTVDLQFDPFFGLNCQHQINVVVRNEGPGTVNQKGVLIGAWLSLDGDVDNLNGDDIPLGGPSTSIFGGVDLELDPGETATFGFLSNHVPANAALGPQFVVGRIDMGGGPCAAVCEEEEFDNEVKVPVQVQGPSAGVVGISYNGNLYSGESRPIDVTVRNSDLVPLDVPVTVSFGQNSATGWVYDVPSGGTKTGSVLMTIPSSPLNCGAPDPFSITACTTLSLDLAPFDDCKTISGVPVFERYWDLKVEFAKTPPSSADLNQKISWRVRWTNVGDMLSESVCFRTGIAKKPGDNNWGTTPFVINACGPGPVQTYQVPELQPGETHTRTFSMCIHPTAATVVQYLKVGVDNFNGCFDFCTKGKNFIEHKIDIDF